MKRDYRPHGASIYSIEYIRVCSRSELKAHTHITSHSITYASQSFIISQSALRFPRLMMTIHNPQAPCERANRTTECVIVDYIYI